MWADYSVRYIKNNKASSLFLAVISFISTAFLTLLCSMAYNLWVDHINQIMIKEGSYTARFEPLAAAFGLVIAAACISLILMIHSAFEVPMNSRIHQLGILQSVGATPRQISEILLEEVMILCAVPIVLGITVGIGISYLLMQTTIILTGDIRIYDVSFHFHVIVVLFSLLASVATVLLSAWLPARKLSRLTPLIALSYGVETDIAKMQRFQFISRLFGIHGELARKSIYARRKELRTSTLSLAFAFLALTGLLNIEVISGISTQFTYFDRFRDKWDMMLTTDDVDANLLDQVKAIEGVKSCIAYKKVGADTHILEKSFSKELQEIGIHNLNREFVCDKNQDYPFYAWMYILDDDSFAEYCRNHQVQQNGIAAVNTIWDSIHSSKKYREYIPLVDQDKPLNVDIAGNQLTIRTYTTEMPNIKEEYQQFSLSLILSQSFYHKIEGSLPSSDTIYNISITSSKSEETVKEQIENIMTNHADYTLKNRFEEERSELKIRSAFRIFIYCFAGFLAVIGIVNIFSFTLGQIYQRRKEFARYFSVGLSPKGMRKILVMEAVIISVRPLLLSIFVNIPLVAWALHAADISISEYMARAPVWTIGIFTLFVFLFIALAYYIGGRKISSGDFVEIIKDETML